MSKYTLRIYSQTKCLRAYGGTKRQVQTLFNEIINMEAEEIYKRFHYPYQGINVNWGPKHKVTAAFSLDLQTSKFIESNPDDYDDYYAIEISEVLKHMDNLGAYALDFQARPVPIKLIEPFVTRALEVMDGVSREIIGHCLRSYPSITIRLLAGADILSDEFLKTLPQPNTWHCIEPRYSRGISHGVFMMPPSRITQPINRDPEDLIPGKRKLGVWRG